MSNSECLPGKAGGTPAYARRHENGAGNETRTRDIYLGKVVLYQLSYARSGDEWKK